MPCLMVAWRERDEEHMYIVVIGPLIAKEFITGQRVLDQLVKSFWRHPSDPEFKPRVGRNSPRVKKIPSLVRCAKALRVSGRGQGTGIFSVG